MRTLRRQILLLLLIVLFVSSFSPMAFGVSPSKTALAAKFEQMAMKLMPQRDLKEMLGFFGPVTRKYMPVFKRFNREYLTGTNKVTTIRRYLPQAYEAIGEAKAMEVPAKYEKKKTDYVNKVETFISIVSLMTK